MAAVPNKVTAMGSRDEEVDIFGGSREVIIWPSMLIEFFILLTML